MDSEPTPDHDPARMSRISPTAVVHTAGGLSLLGWGALAWTSHGSSPTWLPLGVVWCGNWLLGAWAWWRTRATWSELSPLILFGWALLFRLCGLFSQPVLEDDHYRFLWDGRQLIESGNPYAQPPSAFFGATNLPPEWNEILDRVNYPQVPTVYGPVCEYAFGLSHLLAPGQLWPWRLILMAAEVLVIFLIARAAGLRAASFAAWCPLSVLEVSFNVHPDMLGVALLLTGLVLTRRTAVGIPWGGVLLGFAVASKLTALVLIPFVLVRRAPREIGGVFAGLIFAYLPFWVQGSTAEWPGLRTFAAEWEFNSAGFAALQWLTGTHAARSLSLLAFTLVWLGLFWSWCRPRRPVADADWPPGDAVFGALLFFSATINSWYLLWILPFAARRRTATATVALAAVGLSYLTGINLGRTDLGPFDHPIWLRPLEFGLIGLAAAFDLRQRFFKGRAGPPDSTPD